ncbi:hypothetical protein EZJ43_04125 [Pedobacter changchengzhani]|uniref:Lipoprotein n=1 Tax=Pedobacter changchengzhani TaxID=2529274 RepID=A0A4R5MNG7_9SPHI|nr:hypothetical protein [Pedobacter changchengzhani]TDG37312.1 hypothetical protein EZJ43_04125 [Pedobacter changchengzhani]
MKISKIFPFSIFTLFLSGCLGNMNPTGSNSSPNYPWFVVKQPLLVKNILVPTGTTLTYNEDYFKTGEQDKAMSEKKLKSINFPANAPLNWGGVPVTSISKFFNSEMHGVSVNANFKKLPDENKTRFSRLWESCDSDMGILLKNTNDWSFNKANIADVESCSVLYQRYFKDNAAQQTFLNNMYNELLKVKEK